MEKSTRALHTKILTTPFRVEYVFVAAGGVAQVIARQLDPGNFSVDAASTLGGVQIHAWLDQPRALTSKGHPDTTIFGFALVNGTDRDKLTIGQAVELISTCANMASTTRLSIASASNDDAPSIVQLRNTVAAQLSAAHGRGHWSSCVTAQTVLRELRESRVLVLRVGNEVAATLRLATKKPWAIDASYFTTVTKAVYLHGVAVHPKFQRLGIGRKLVAQAKVVATQWPSDAIRLDAYDSPAGATSFYVSCGFREVGRVVYRRIPLVYLELIL